MCAVGCLGTNITGPYAYTVNAPSFVGDTMSVSCQTGYAWNSSPSVGSARTATCTESAGSGVWVLSGLLDQCLRKSFPIPCAFYLNSSATIALWMPFVYIVDCSAATITGQVSYTVPSIATIGTKISVNCKAGYEWTASPYSGSQSATCTDVSGTGQWVISGGPTCVCMFVLVYQQFDSVKLVM